MRPRIAEAETHCSFLGSELCWRFDYGAQRITNLAGVFAVGVVDAPELIAWLRSLSRGCAHGCSSAQREFAKMYQIHKMRGQSFPMSLEWSRKSKVHAQSKGRFAHCSTEDAFAKIEIT